GRITHPAGRAYGRGTGVVGERDRKLGRGEYRLAGRVGDVGRRLREAGVLAFVVRDDPFETVVGVEPALPRHPRGVRLDAEPEVHDGIDVGMVRDEVEDDRDRVARLAAGEVDRIVAAPAGWQVLVDRGEQVAGQRRQLERAVARD